MEVLKIISLLCLWAVTGLNIWPLIRNIRQYKQYRSAVDSYLKAAEECIAAAAAYEQARDNYIQATKKLEKEGE